MKKDASVLLKSVRYWTEEIKPCKGEAHVLDRQERVPGFDQTKLSSLVISMIGAGGLGSEIGEGLIRKGIFCLKIFDGDVVELSNLNRQRFYKEDLYQNKALGLAKNLVKEGTKKSLIIGYPFPFQEAVEKKIDTSCDLAVCGVDNNETRKYVSRFYYTRRVPVVFTAVSEDANHGYVFVQEKNEACFGCLFPEALNDNREPCPNTPAVKDILKVVAGIVLYTVDSLIMKRKRNWNYKEVFLAGFVPDTNRIVERRKNCPLCQGVKK